MATEWRIYGKDTVARKLDKAELPGFFQKKVTIGHQEAALVVKNGRVVETVTQAKEVVVGFWERLKGAFGVDTEAEVYIVDTTPIDLLIYLGRTDKEAGTAGFASVTPPQIKPPAGDRKYFESVELAAQAQRDVSNLTLLAVTADKEVVNAECRLRVSISTDDIGLITNALKGRSALSVWDLAALVKDELMARVLLPRVARLRAEELRGNRELLATLETDVRTELLKTLSIWGLKLESFVINWGITEEEAAAIMRKRQNREEEARIFAHGRRLADMQRDLELKQAEIDNLRQLKEAEARRDEAAKAILIAAEVDRHRILEGKRLNVARVDTEIAQLQLDIKRREQEINFEFERRRKELEADLDRREMEELTRQFEAVQRAKRERQKQEQDFMTQQMTIQTGSTERIMEQAIEKGVADPAALREMMRQQTLQRALDRDDAKVESLGKAEAAKYQMDTYKEAEDRERRHQSDMAEQAARMMEASKQGVPDTLVQGGGVTPVVHVSAQADTSNISKCSKCGQPVRAGWRFCPACGEPVVQ